MSLVLAPSPASEPSILHWGAALGDLSPEHLADLTELRTPGVPHSALDQPRVRGVVGDNGSGFTGTPGLEGVRLGDDHAAWSPRLRGWTWHVVDDDPEADARVELHGVDAEAGWEVRIDLELTREGVLRTRPVVTNTGRGRLQLAAARSALPVAARATELVDLTGRWCRERTPLRRPFLIGTHLREGRHGRTGHDASLLMAAGTPGFGFRTGEVWATHLAWSGDHATYAERTVEGECLLGGGELLGPGEVVLGEGETYYGPWFLGCWSGAGLDGASDRLHAWVRRHADRSRRVRPVLVNTWEAAYFDHDLDRLGALAEAAARVGVERFVLDDGWMHGRRSDRAALGDWTVDRSVWPEGLHPLIEKVRSCGMDFGLWVEPEMVNEDSDLAREHPDWILRGRHDVPPEWRHQQVLDLQVPGAYAHVRDALLELLDEYDIAYLKWDHNRDLIDVAHAGRPAVHRQTLSFYRLLDELRGVHPHLEIESCASGGARIDLEVLRRTDRVWPSDTIDAIERQRIQTWTSLVVPPEMMGAHLGGPVAHTTGRTHTMTFRAATALLGHFGIEWDLSSLGDEELDRVAAWVALHKRVRPLLATGRTVRGDHPDPALSVTGVVAADGSEAWYVVATVATTLTQSPLSVQLPGLDPSRTYRLTNETVPGERHPSDLATTWVDGRGVEVPGSALEAVGVRLPATAPESAYVLHAVAVEEFEPAVGVAGRS